MCALVRVFSMDGLEPPMLDETWGMSNRTLEYKGKYSKNTYLNGDESTTNFASSLKDNFGKGKYSPFI